LDRSALFTGELHSTGNNNSVRSGKLMNDHIIGVLEQRFGARNIVILPEVCVVRARYSDIGLLQSVILTWPQAAYLASHPDISDKDLVDERLPVDWPLPTWLENLRSNVSARISRRRHFNFHPK